MLLTRTVILICAVGLHAPSSLAATLTADRIYEGSTVDGIQTFLGIPFAQADRWQAPQPLPPSTDEVPPVKANQFPPACMQTDHIVRWYRNLIDDFGGDPESFQAPEMAEECLYLNIWAPEQSHEQPLPVVIYISKVEVIKVAGHTSPIISALNSLSADSSLLASIIGWGSSDFLHIPIFLIPILRCWIKSLRCNGSIDISVNSVEIARTSPSWVSQRVPVT